MEKMNIAKRLQEEARKDRVKLIFGAVAMTLLVLVLVFAVTNAAKSHAVAMAVLMPAITAL